MLNVLTGQGVNKVLTKC